MRYAGQYPAFFWQYPADDAVEILIDAALRENDEKVFLRWVVGYQMEMSLAEFKHQLAESSKSTDEILRGVYKDIECFNLHGLRREM